LLAKLIDILRCELENVLSKLTTKLTCIEGIQTNKHLSHDQSYGTVN